MNHRPIVALDFPNKQQIETFLSHFPKEESLYVKVGMELFYQEGPDIVRWLKSLGHDIFLDLKLHDIPNTVESAMRGIARLGVNMVNVHAAGGKRMMAGALNGLEEGSIKGKRPILLAVTQLTSTSEEEMHEDQGLTCSLKESVLHYAKSAEISGLDGVVCSALEAADIKTATHSEFVCLTPGIRPQGASVGDQKRVVTPKKARELSSSYIVVGRPITRSEQPYESYLSIKKEWNGDV